MNKKDGTDMLIKEERRDLCSINEGIIVHGCNAQGVMGAGIALQLKTKYPVVFIKYIDALKKINRNERERIVGNVIWVRIHSKLLVANGITQLYYGRAPNRQYVSYDAIRSVFRYVSNKAIEQNMPIYFHKIGATLGGGDWSVIRKIIEETVDSRVSMTLCLVN